MRPFGQHEAVRRGCQHDPAPQVGEELELEGRVAAGYRNHRATETFAAVVEAQATGEQAVAVAVVEDVLGAGAGQCQCPCVHLGPDRQVVWGVDDDGRLSAGPGTGVEAGRFRHGDGDHAQRVLVTQVLLDGERQRAEVLDRGDGGRVDGGQTVLPEGVAAAGEAGHEGGQALALEGVFLRRGQADHVNRVEGSAEHPRILDPGRIWDPEE